MLKNDKSATIHISCGNKIRTLEESCPCPVIVHGDNNRDYKTMFGSWIYKVICGAKRKETSEANF